MIVNSVAAWSKRGAYTPERWYDSSAVEEEHSCEKAMKEGKASYLRCQEKIKLSNMREETHENAAKFSAPLVIVDGAKCRRARGGTRG